MSDKKKQKKKNFLVDILDMTGLKEENNLIEWYT